MTEAKNPFADDVNPYLATTLEADADPYSLDGAEGIRRAHIAHEASVKSVGTLYVIGFLLLLVIGLGVFSMWNVETYRALLAGGFYLGLVIAQGITGYGLWRLRPWARWIAVAFSILGLLAVPLGTIVSAYILYLLISRKGTMVFSEPYQQIIAQTPHVKYKTSIVVWIILLVLLAMMTLAITMALIG